MDAQLSPFEWIVQHLQLVGWPTLVVIAWKLRGVFETFLHNHLEYVQASLDRIEAGQRNQTEASERDKDPIVQAIIAVQ